MARSGVWTVALLVVLVGCGGSDSALPGTGGEPVQPGGIPPALAEGSRIFFVSARDGNQELYAMRGDGSQPTNLSRHAAHDFNPAVSADGQRIAFARLSEERVALMFLELAARPTLTVLYEDPELEPTLDLSPDGRRAAFTEFDHVLGVVNTDGTGLRHGIFRQELSGGVVFSPDGSRLAVFAPSEVTFFALYLVNADGSESRLVADRAERPFLDAASPSFSPDGRRLAFSATLLFDPESEPEPSADLYMVNADGTGLRRLTDTRRPESDPVWSPDGSKLAFVRHTSEVEGYRDLGTEVVVLDLATGREVNVSNHEADDRGPVWSPDGEWLAFTSDRDEDEEVYAVRADGSGLTRLTNSAGQDEVAAWRPAVSPPAAGRILFASFVSPGGLFTMDANGEDLRQLTRGEPVAGAALSPDGRRVVAATAGDDPGLDLMNADGSGRTRLYDGPAGQPVFSPDGGLIAFIDRSEFFEVRPPAAIHVIRIDGSGHRSLTDPTGDTAVSRYPTFSPDGRQIAFASAPRLFDEEEGFVSGPADIYRVNVDGSDLVNLTRSPAIEDGPRFNPRDGTIAFVRGFGGLGDLFAMNADGSGEARLTQGANVFLGELGPPAVSPDGRRLAFVSRSSEPGTLNDDLAVVNADGSGLRVVARPADVAGCNAGPVFSPDSRRIAFTRDLCSAGLVSIWRVNVDGSGLVPLGGTTGRVLGWR